MRIYWWSRTKPLDSMIDTKLPLGLICLYKMPQTLENQLYIGKFKRQLHQQPFPRNSLQPSSATIPAFLSAQPRPKTQSRAVTMGLDQDLRLYLIYHPSIHHLTTLSHYTYAETLRTQRDYLPTGKLASQPFSKTGIKEQKCAAHPSTTPSHHSMGNGRVLPSPFGKCSMVCHHTNENKNFRILRNASKVMIGPLGSRRSEYKYSK